MFVVLDLGTHSVPPSTPVSALRFDPFSAAGIRNILDHVARAISPGTVFDGMLGVFARPQAESVVMLADQDQAAHTGGFGGAGDLLGVKGGRIEETWGFIARTPFPIHESVHAEVDKAVKLQLVPEQLLDG